MHPSHTLSLIRQLTAIGVVKPRRKIGRWPAPVHPDLIGNEYTAAIVRMAVVPAHREMQAVMPEILALLVSLRREQGRADAYDPEQARVPAGQPGGGEFGSGGGARSVGTHEYGARAVHFHERITPPENAAIQKYKEAAYHEVNGDLRAGKPVREGDGRAEVARQLDRALAKAPPLDHPITVQRGFKFLNIHGENLSFNVGDKYTDPAFVSATAKSARTKLPGIAANSDYYARIIVKPGVRAGFIDKPGGTNQREQEVLLPRGLQYHVVERGKATVQVGVNRRRVTTLVIEASDPHAHLDADPGGLGKAAAEGRKSAEKDTRKAARSSAEIDAELRAGSEQGRRAARLIDHAAAQVARLFHPGPLHDVVHQFGNVTDRHSRLQLDQQLRTAIGVPLSAIEKPHRDRLEGWAAANVDLIVTLPPRYFDDIRGKVLDAFEGGVHPYDLADDMADCYGISESRAEVIARDQTLSLAADLNHDRMTALGVTRATWRTMRDGRVCDICEPREGVEFDMSEGIDGELPGDCHPQDRCFSEPDLSDLLA